MRKVLICILVIAASAIFAQPARKTKAELAYEHFKSLAGEWHGTASDGRKIRHKYTLVGGDSVVMEESWFEAHPGSKMVTMYYLDAGKLMLVHYCVAKNQPRMEATEISDDGKKVLFTFVDGGNLPSRDKGHMDKASYAFHQKDKFSNKWTWYASGKEQWMEEFTYLRGASK